MKKEELYKVAIHEAGHLVVRYLLFGNIDTIKSVSVGVRAGTSGRNQEDMLRKENEIMEAFYQGGDYCRVGGYAYNESCYSLAGVIADKVNEGLDHIPFYYSDVDMFSLYSFLGMYLRMDSDEIDSLVEKAIPETERIVNDNFEIIKRIADAVISAPGHDLDNKSLLRLLVGYFGRKKYVRPTTSKLKLNSLTLKYQ